MPDERRQGTSLLVGKAEFESRSKLIPILPRVMSMLAMPRVLASGVHREQPRPDGDGENHTQQRAVPESSGRGVGLPHGIVLP